MCLISLWHKVGAPPHPSRRARRPLWPTRAPRIGGGRAGGRRARPGVVGSAGGAAAGQPAALLLRAAAHEGRGVLVTARGWRRGAQRSMGGSDERVERSGQAAVGGHGGPLWVRRAACAAVPGPCGGPVAGWVSAAVEVFHLPSIGRRFLASCSVPFPRSEHTGCVPSHSQAAAAPVIGAQR
jgi:hypothetical protein